MRSGVVNLRGAIQARASSVSLGVLGADAVRFSFFAGVAGKSLSSSTVFKAVDRWEPKVSKEPKNEEVKDAELVRDGRESARDPSEEK